MKPIMIQISSVVGVVAHQFAGLAMLISRTPL